MRIGEREFSPPWWAILLFLLVGTTMLLLGKWQLARASEKIRLMATAEAAANAQPVDIAMLAHTVRFPDQRENPGCEIKPGEAGTYIRVVVAGEFDQQRQFLWDNRVYKGVAGYEVLTPLMLNLASCIDPDAPTQSVALLVNRGWVAANRDRTVLPNIDLAIQDTQSDTEKVRLQGMLTLPSKGFAADDALIDRARATRPWPAILQYPDYRAVAQVLDVPVMAGVLQATENIDSNVAAKLYDSNWSPVANGPEKHYGYAFQWFAMFAALCIIFIVTNLQRATDKTDTTETS